MSPKAALRGLFKRIIRALAFRSAGTLGEGGGVRGATACVLPESCAGTQSGASHPAAILPRARSPAAPTVVLFVVCIKYIQNWIGQGIFDEGGAVADLMPRPRMTGSGRY